MREQLPAVPERMLARQGETEREAAERRAHAAN